MWINEFYTYKSTSNNKNSYLILIRLLNDFVRNDIKLCAKQHASLPNNEIKFNNLSLVLLHVSMYTTHK